MWEVGGAGGHLGSQVAPAPSIQVLVAGSRRLDAKSFARTGQAPPELIASVHKPLWPPFTSIKSCYRANKPRWRKSLGFQFAQLCPVLVSLPALPDPHPPQNALILLGARSCPGSRGEASSRGPGSDWQWGPLFPATFKAHKLLI